MAASRNDQERQRLAEQYAGMTEVELEDLAEDAASLTELARDVLRSEIVRRGLDIVVPEPSAAVQQEPAPQLPILRIYRDLPDALLARSLLDSGGIHCFLFDENIVRLNWLWSNCVGGVKLRVKEEDANDADQFLNQPRPERFVVGGVGEYVQPRCPACQSLDVSFRELIKRAVYAYLLFSLPVPLTRPAWKCHSCGCQWEDDSEAPTDVP
ncbi:MAG TPA: hypothetical protein VJW93_09005 [Candidatus Acidoferrales bacterium]|nr:hypothetical protein [Candidatus Acidoferrales bacterium]